ncbi:MAG: FAD-binding protein [Mycobacteriales bacterium]
MSESYDLIVIGTGGAAMAAGIEARTRGASVLLVEQGALGAPGDRGRACSGCGFRARSWLHRLVARFPRPGPDPGRRGQSWLVGADVSGHPVGVLGSGLERPAYRRSCHRPAVVIPPALQGWSNPPFLRDTNVPSSYRLEVAPCSSVRPGVVGKMGRNPGA